MPIEIADIILLLAAAQGLFLTILVFHKHGHLFANRFLGALLLLYSIMLFHLLLGELGYSQNHPYFTLIIIGLAYLIPPLHYLYAKFLVHNSVKFTKATWWHLLPFLVYEGLRFPQLLQPREELLALYGNLKPNRLPIESIVYNWTLLLQGFIYMGLTIRILNRYARRIKDVFSSIEKVKLDWLRNITYMATGAFVVFAIENFLLLFDLNLSNYFTLSSVLIALYVYALGYLGLFKSEVFSIPAIADSISQLATFDLPARKETRTEMQKYEKSGLSEEKAEEYLRQLLDLMQAQQPYTNSDLTLNQLAEMLSISPHNLSEVINTQLRQNFFDFINHYRLEKVKKDLADPEKKNLKILAIAYEAGFNSKSAFNTIFKKHTDTTPSEYRQHLLHNYS